MIKAVLDKLQIEHKSLICIKQELEKEVQKAPEGSLRVDRCHNDIYFRCYKKEEKHEHKNGQYIHKDNKQLAIDLAQKEYNRKALTGVTKLEKGLDNLLKCYEQNNLEIIYNGLGEVKKSMITPIVLPDDKYIDKWKKEKKTDINTYENVTNIFSEIGEHVRSKSEKILADKFMMEGIPYVYEPNVVLKDGSQIFADFALLNVRTRQDYYLEHFGMMDNPEYARRAVQKMEMYYQNGYYMGKNIIYTFETSDIGLGKDVIDRIVREYLK
ncbi:hypothetical protein [Butyrivibrio proteoclasticus]|uniref:hypothetical protein n=1 Tax=Butyrivibrio proteoclasticus TaxID=43305 RepID=UPI00047A5EED|nr:hypothetical protein [Butyrivibrio proteoclasticus]